MQILTFSVLCKYQTDNVWKYIFELPLKIRVVGNESQSVTSLRPYYIGMGILKKKSVFSWKC